MKILRMSVYALLLGTLAITAAGVVNAETRRAVIIGIDQYEIPGVVAVPRGDPPDPRGWRNLEGAVNDATRMQTLLIARYEFPKDNITFLSNQAATREGILGSVRSHLIAESESGDIAFFYYAGHGSRVRNSLSPESDKLDESIVPADAAKGVRDIRDKELRDQFNALLDKGVKVVAIFDSCHSGSITRGAAGTQPANVRMLPIDPRDVKDGSRAPSPWARGAVILSAAQQDQLAAEARDEYGQAGGAFTLSLSRALQAGNAQEPAQNLFRRVKALMTADAAGQEPVLEGTNERKSQPLFGVAAGEAIGRTLAAVQAVEGQRVTLQEGVAAGLTIGTELVKVGASAPRLKISQVEGLVKSEADAVEGDAAQIKAGDLYVVDRWAPPDVPSLRVWIPLANQTPQELMAFSETLKALATREGYTWVEDTTAETPTHVVLFDGAVWQLAWPDGRVTPLGSEPTAEKITRLLADAPASPVKLFLNLPAPEALARAIKLGDDTPNSAVEPVEDRAAAHYHLVGRYQSDGLAYAWVRPWVSGDSETTLPTRTDWEVLTGPPQSTASKLETYAVRLGRVRAWLQLEGPPGETDYPYRLSLKPPGRDTLIADGILKEGDSFSLALTSDAQVPATAPSRYVYVFAIDSHGTSTLLFPFGGAVENRFPPEQDQRTPKALYTLPGTEFEISPPFGVDTFVLIATAEQLPDPSVLEAEGVRTRGSRSGATSLEDLLGNVGARTRGIVKRAAPVNWSIQRASFETTPGG